MYAKIRKIQINIYRMHEYMSAPEGVNTQIEGRDT